VAVEDGRLVRAALRAAPDAAPAPSSAQGAAADPAGLDADVHAAQLADLLAAAGEGREPAVSGQDGRDALEIVLAAYESSRAGRPVRLGR
jgi:predicted dehydrogenase